MSFEQLVICHCAPVLRGIKVSNLVSCSNKEFPLVKTESKKLDERFKPFGLRCKILCECKKFSLVFVYSEQDLLAFISRKENCSYLKNSGYKSEISGVPDLERMIDGLSLRLSNASCDGFPHEIGVFLGYPIEDVVGFEENHGENFKYSGYWKVYGNIEKAKELFYRYDLCSKECTRMAMKGIHVEDVICCADSEACVRTRVA